ncbi:helix-turn-helix domain-containing protein [Pseudarthrobacter sp. Y6]|uniref:helix-turn-helix domain-containing protein n=1 Tax=Pseudarthrobacter sp. Y6 TaxID=3418422 RepID=UPI003CFB1318
MHCASLNPSQSSPRNSIFGRAAGRFYIAQSSVSQQMQKLEAELGVALFYRSSRKVALTPAGSHAVMTDRPHRNEFSGRAPGASAAPQRDTGILLGAGPGQQSTSSRICSARYISATCTRTMPMICCPLKKPRRGHRPGPGDRDSASALARLRNRTGPTVSS